MTRIGNHMKFNIHKDLRDRVRAFYVDILDCSMMPSPAENLDLFVLSDGFVLGVFYCEADQLLSGEDHLKAAWLEIKSTDVSALKQRLVEFGVNEVEYSDKTRFFFQAPGGQVFRLAPEDGGI